MASSGRNTIGPYRPLRLVRAGHSCQIWEAIRDATGQRVALKVLQAEHRKDREQIACLRHECLVGQGLKHPHLIGIYEFAVDNGIPYVSMEYFESRNLKQWLRTDRESAAGAELIPQIIEQAGLGLAYLHDQGWIHRDVKPDNFLVNSQGTVKLIDLAIARRIRGGWNRLLPLRGKIQGTRSYMSPEQIRGGRLDQRADIYSFGCMLFEIVGGRPPYTGENSDHLLQKHLSAAVPPLASVCDAVTPQFAALVAAMMAKVPDARPATMHDVLREVRGLRVIRERRT